MKSLSRRRRESGSALILVFWCLLLLGMAVFGVIELVEISLEHSADSEMRIEAHALAASGIALGLQPQLLGNDPLLLQKPSAGRQFAVRIEDEAARLNLNFLLLNGHRDVLVTLFTQWGMAMHDANRAADCLYDWVTPGDIHSLNGAKANDYAEAGLPQRPSHEPFKSWSEVGQVMGIDELTAARPNWRDSFTLWSDGPLNVNEAPAELIAALFGVSVGLVEPMTEARDGADGIPGTADDKPIEGPAALQADLGLTDLKMQPLLGQFTFASTVRHIESAGQAGDSRVVISAVARLNSAPPQYLLWSEP